MRKDRILVIEDESELGKALKIILELNMFDVFVAENGTDGLAIAENNLLDIVLSDINLPDMSGYDILKMIRSNKKLQHMPFIFMTAFAEDGEMQDGLKVGASAYLTKPFTSKELVTTIRKRLEMSRSKTPSI